MRKYLTLLLLLFGCQKIETSFKVATTGSDLKSAISNKPNIILIVGDDVGYELLSCNGGQSYETPNLDAMASAGVRYTNCYGSPDCATSRCMILTGKYNFRNYSNWGYMSDSEKTIANVMHEAGRDRADGARRHVDDTAPLALLHARNKGMGAQKHAIDRGLRIGLYHDLALATDRFGSDLWAHGPYYISGCRVGAPPSVVFILAPRARISGSRIDGWSSHTRDPSG